MNTTSVSHPILEAARVAPEIYVLRPDYRALLIIVENIPPGPSDDTSEALLRAAEASVKEQQAHGPVTEFPHVAAWRDVYRAFGAKPAKHRNSLEALSRRVEKGLPRVNRLTDIYNAISLKYQIPLGGEDLDKYSGSARLIRATGAESFQISSSNGELQTEHAEPGEPIWCDDAGITCRRWNWRQGPRTALTDDTTRALFILDALGPLTDEALLKAGEELITVLKQISPEVTSVQKLVRKSG